MKKILVALVLALIVGVSFASPPEQVAGGGGSKATVSNPNFICGIYEDQYVCVLCPEGGEEGPFPICDAFGVYED